VEKYFQIALTRTDEDKFVAISGIVRELITIRWHGLLKGDGSVEDKLEYRSGFWIGISTWTFYGRQGALAWLPCVSVVYLRGFGHRSTLLSSSRCCNNVTACKFNSSYETT
jgi:hypothetical protein